MLMSLSSDMSLTEGRVYAGLAVVAVLQLLECGLPFREPQDSVNMKGPGGRAGGGVGGASLQ